MLAEAIFRHLISFAVCSSVSCVILWVVLNNFYHLEGGAPIKKCILAALLMGLSAVVTGFVCAFIPFIGIIIFVLVWYKLCSEIVESIFEMTEGTDLPVFIILIVYVCLKHAMYDYL